MAEAHEQVTEADARQQLADQCRHLGPLRQLPEHAGHDKQDQDNQQDIQCSVLRRLMVTL